MRGERFSVRANKNAHTMCSSFYEALSQRIKNLRAENNLILTDDIELIVSEGLQQQHAVANWK
jgi:hypothetical protein